MWNNVYETGIYYVYIPEIWATNPKKHTSTEVCFLIFNIIKRNFCIISFSVKPNIILISLQNYVKYAILYVYIILNTEHWKMNRVRISENFDFAPINFLKAKIKNKSKNLKEVSNDEIK